MSDTCILLNPASGGGAALKRWRALSSEADDIFDDPTVIASAAPGQLRAAAREIAASREAVTILAAGGDGTSHEVLNGIVAAGPSSAARMGWIPIGSGNDLARAVGVPLALGATMPAYRKTSRATIDIGQAEYRSPAGNPVVLAFGNSLTLGLSVAVLELAERSGKPLGGRLGYLAATIRALTRPAGEPWRLAIDGRPEAPERLRLIAVTNGPTIGAGMRIAPAARLDDGHFELTRVAAVPMAGAMAILSRIYRGGHLGDPAVRQERVTRLEVDGDGPFAFEADGELIRGRLPLAVTIRPRALRILRPTPRAGG